jgi:hypothetical protein
MATPLSATARVKQVSRTSSPSTQPAGSTNAAEIDRSRTNFTFQEDTSKEILLPVIDMRLM